MDLINLTNYIVKSIVTEPDSVIVTEIPTDEDNSITIQVKVNEQDIGKIIGKHGKVANSIRSLVQESSTLKDNKFVKIKIEKN